MVASFGAMVGCHGWVPFLAAMSWWGAMLGCHCWPFLGAMAGCHVVVLFVLLAGAMVAQLETK